MCSENSANPEACAETAEKKMNWLGQIQRRSDESIAKQTLHGH